MRRLSFIAACLLAMACYTEEVPPILDVAQAVPGAKPIEAAPNQSQGSSPTTDPFADPNSQKEKTTEPSGSGVPIGGGLWAALPSSSGQWIWGYEDDRALIVHRNESDVYDVVIYTQKFKDTYTKDPSQEMGRFFGDVDPMLNTATRAAILTGELVASTADPEYSPGGMAAALRAVGSRTLGMGFGYLSNARSFTGWRWFGANRKGVLLQMGRTQGDWSSLSAAEFGTMATWIRENIPELDELADKLDEAKSQTESISSSARGPSFMVVGHAKIGLSNGVHFAALCAANPGCQESDSIAKFIDSIQTGNMTRETRGAQGFDQVAQFAGLVFTDPGESLDVDTVLEILKAKQESLASSTSGTEASGTDTKAKKAKKAAGP